MTTRRENAPMRMRMMLRTQRLWQWLGSNSTSWWSIFRNGGVGGTLFINGGATTIIIISQDTITECGCPISTIQRVHIVSYTGTTATTTWAPLVAPHPAGSTTVTQGRDLDFQDMLRDTQNTQNVVGNAKITLTARERFALSFCRDSYKTNGNRAQLMKRNDKIK